MSEHHGHEVIEMMENSEKVYSHESLKSDIIEKFGAEATFYTCSDSGMDADALIDCLKHKGKFMEKDDGFVFNTAMKCSH